MSSYGTGKVAPALGVECPSMAIDANGTMVSCGAFVGESCVNFEGATLLRCHSARRRAADAKRTTEVNIGSNWTAAELEVHDREKAADEAKWLAEAQTSTPIPNWDEVF